MVIAVFLFRRNIKTAADGEYAYKVDPNRIESVKIKVAMRLSLVV